MILVLAGNFQEYRDFLRRHGMESLQTRIVYVHDAKQTYGYGSNTALLCVGTWRDRNVMLLRQVQLNAMHQGMWILAGC